MCIRDRASTTYKAVWRGNDNTAFDLWVDVYKRQILAQDYQFEGPAVLTAHFEENPDAWITIAFEAGEHGSINTGEALTLRTTYDKKWSDIQGSTPQCTPQVNYLPDGWYANGEPVEDDTPLVNGQTYTMEFYPDPAVFGTDVSAPNALAGLNTQGKGRVTIFGTAQGYKYILTDLAGEVLAVNKGNCLLYTSGP